MSTEGTAEPSGDCLAQQPTAAGRADEPGAAAASAPNQREPGHRRVLYDRRRLIRFDADRRAEVQRRLGAEPWAIP